MSNDKENLQNDAYENICKGRHRCSIEYSYKTAICGIILKHAHLKVLTGIAES